MSVSIAVIRTECTSICRWVEALNDGHIPETTDELYEYLKKVKNEDPNGNGLADEVP